MPEGFGCVNLSAYRDKLKPQLIPECLYVHVLECLRVHVPECL